MRIQRLDLTRYGSFTDRSIELPAGEFDFHVVYGPNEAGKSTIRNAVADLLYGIPGKSPFRFIHDYSEMCIGALVQGKEQSLDFKRLKRNKASLLDAEDKPLPDNVLAPFVMDTDREFFLRMFALSHQELIQGGREILDSSGDLGQMLFQAAAGLGTFQTIKLKLDAEAESLWGPRSKESRAYNQALARMEEAKSKLHAVQVTKGKWATARRALDDAEALLATTNSDRVLLVVESDRLLRVQRISAPLVQLDDAVSQLAGLSEVIRLPADAASILNSAALKMATATAQARVHRDTASDAAAKLADLKPDLPLLAKAADVQRLAGLIASVSNSERDIPKREIEVAQQKSTLLTAAKEVGWNELDPTEIADRVPSKLLRADIEDLIARHATLTNSLSQRAAAVAREESALRALTEEASALPDVSEHPALAAALTAVQSLNLDERQDQLESDIASATRSLTQALSELLPWTGDAAALTLARPPEPSELQGLLDARKTLQLEITNLQQSVADRELTAAGLDSKLKQERRAHSIVTAEELWAARGRRDQTFAEIVAGAKDVVDAAPAFAEEVKDADLLADRRYEGADDAARLQTLADSAETLQVEIERLGEQRLAIENKLREAEDAWSARAAALGLASISLDRMPQWSQKRTAAIAATGVLDECRDRSAKFTGRAQSCLEALRVELGNAGSTAEPEADPGTLIAQATGVLSARIANRTRRELVLKQQRDCEARLIAARQETETAGAQMGTWQREWEAKVTLANLAPDCTTVAASAAMGIFRNMDACLEKIRALQDERINPMRRDVQLFEAEVTALVAHCAPELSNHPSKDAITELTNRLAKAKAEESDQERLTHEIAVVEKSLSQCNQDAESAQVTLRPLYEQAGVTEVDDLREAIASSDRAQALDRTTAELRASIIAGGDGLTLEALQEEVAKADLPQLGAQLEVTAGKLRELDEQRERLVERRALAKDDYLKIAGSDEAAKAESKRQGALTEMGTVAEEYVRVSTGAHLLRWALERYREEKQGPLLATASGYFSDLTNGVHAKLLVETGGDIRLVSRRSNGALVGVEGMSDGTSDQLYLALRLAALEMRLQESAPMPFIADDLLINCDDDRTASSLIAFERLASKTQVFYFTHHKHLIDIARTVTKNRVNIVEI